MKIKRLLYNICLVVFAVSVLWLVAVRAAELDDAAPSVNPLVTRIGILLTLLGAGMLLHLLIRGKARLTEPQDEVLEVEVPVAEASEVTTDD